MSLLDELILSGAFAQHCIDAIRHLFLNQRWLHAAIGTHVSV